MYAKLLIKAAVVVLVINVALVGWITHHSVWLAVALFNLVALFVVLFQERATFQSNGNNKRILFTTDVFGRIAIGVGVMVAGVACMGNQQIPPLVRGVLGGGVFYLLTVAIFGLVPAYWKDMRVRVLSTVIAVIVVVGIAQWIGRLNPTAVGGSYQKLLDRRQGTLQSLVVDEEILPPEEGDEALPAVPVLGTGDDVLSGDVDVTTGSEMGTGLFPIGDGPTTVFPSSVKANQGVLTFANFLPVLMETYEIPPTTNRYTFTNVASNSLLYPSFNLARDYAMIGSNVNPSAQITCRTLMVLLGLIEKRDVSYTPATVFDVFWNQAVNRGYTSYGCEERDGLAQWENLP